MCYKRGVQSSAQDKPAKLSLFPSSYFQRQALRQQCLRCQERVIPEEVKSALGVCTVFLILKTYQWMTNRLDT